MSSKRASALRNSPLTLPMRHSVELVALRLPFSGRKKSVYPFWVNATYLTLVDTYLLQPSSARNEH